MLRNALLTGAALVFAALAPRASAQAYLGSIPTSGYGQNAGYAFGLAIGPNGHLYVSLCGSIAFFNPQFFNNNVVLRINPSTNAVEAVIQVGLFPEEIAFASPATGPAVGIVANSTDGTVTIFDVATDAPIATLTIGSGFFSSFPFGVACNATGTRAYVGGNGPTLFAIDTDGSSATAYQLLPSENIMTSFDGIQRFTRVGDDLVCGTANYLPFFAGSTARIARVPLPGSANPLSSTVCFSASNFTYPTIQDVAVAPNGIAYGAGYDTDGRVYGYNVASGKLVRAFPGGTGSSGLVGAALSPDGKVLVLCDAITNRVAFLDVARGLPIAVVDLTALPFGGFQQPNDAIYSPDGATVYVACQASEAVLRFAAPPSPPPYVTTLGLTIDPTGVAIGGNVHLETSGAASGDFVGILVDDTDSAVDIGSGVLHLTPAAQLLVSANGVDAVLDTAAPADPSLFGKNFLCQAISVDFVTWNIRLSDEVPVVLQ